MRPQLCVDTAGVQTMGSRWAVSVGGLSETVAPAGLGLSWQASAAAVNAAHADITAFTAALVTRVGTRATHIAQANTRYIANEADSANKLATVAHPVTGG
jgi:hypothetical protein